MPPTPHHPSFLPPLISLTNSYIPKCAACAGPAPKITDATPRHNDRTPSVVDIDLKCWVMVVSAGAGRGSVDPPAILAPGGPAPPASTAEGVSEGRICIRVYQRGQLEPGGAGSCEIRTHFYRVDGEDDRVFRNTSLNNELISTPTHTTPSIGKRTRAPAAMLTAQPYPSGNDS